jgi:hypothetical protein
MGSGIGKRIAKEAINRSSGALARTEALEKGQQQIMMAVRQTFGLVDAKLGELSLTQRALINLFGAEQIEAEVKRIQIEDIENKSTQEQVAFAAAVQEGKVVPSTVVGEKTVIIGSEVDENGERLHPVRVQLLYATTNPEFQPQLLGKVVGDVIDTPLKTKFTINELYDIVVPVEGEALATSGAVATEQNAEEVIAPAPTSADENIDAEREEKLVEDLVEGLRDVSDNATQSN